MDADKLAKLRAVCDGYDRRDELNVPYGRTRFEKVFGPETVKALLDVVGAAQAFTSVETIEPWDGEAEASYQGMRDAIAALAKERA